MTGRGRPLAKIRGYRNCNPGNIRRNGVKWQGLRPVQTDPAFFQFVDHRAGLRAAAKLLLTYRRTHGLRTVRQIIGRWAPPVENKTEAYIARVCKLMDVVADADLRIDSSDDRLAGLVAAIVTVELGQQPYAADLIRAAVTAARS